MMRLLHDSKWKPKAEESLLSSWGLQLWLFSCLVFSGWGLAQFWSLWSRKRSMWLWYKSQKPIEILARVASSASRSSYSPRFYPFTAMGLWAILGFVPTWHCLAAWQGSESQAALLLVLAHANGAAGCCKGLICQILIYYSAKWLHDIFVFHCNVRAVAHLDSRRRGRLHPLVGRMMIEPSGLWPVSFGQRKPKTFPILEHWFSVGQGRILTFLAIILHKDQKRKNNNPNKFSEQWL